MTQLKAILSTPDALRAWLQAQEPGAIVGYTCDAHQCPAAMFLRSALGEGTVGVTKAYSGKRSTRKPAWLMTFTERVDAPDPDGIEQIVIRERALAVLDGIEQEAQS